MAPRLFIRRRDGRIEVRLNEAGRDVVRAMVRRVVAAEHDVDDEWNTTLNGPIDPSRDQDDPLLTLARQHDLSSNAELALMTIDEPFLNDGEAWAWLSTLQVALRATASAHGLIDDERINGADDAVLGEIQVLQSLLFSLADVV